MGDIGKKKGFGRLCTHQRTGSEQWMNHCWKHLLTLSRLWYRNRPPSKILQDINVITTRTKGVWEGRVDKGRANRHLTYLFVFFVLRLEEEAFMDCSPSTYLERLSQTVNGDSGVGGNAKHRGPEHLLCKHGIRSLLRCGVFSWKLALSDIENQSRDSSVSPNLLPGEVSA